MSNRVRVEIAEFIATYVYKRMLKPSDFGGSKTQVFEHDSITAYEITASYLENLKIINSLSGNFYGPYKFCCEPKFFKRTIFGNLNSLPSEEGCLKWLFIFVSQLGELDRDPCNSFLARVGLIEINVSQEDTIELREAKKEALESAFLALNIVDPEKQNLIALDVESMEHNSEWRRYELTVAGKRIEDIIYMEAQRLTPYKLY